MHGRYSKLSFSISNYNEEEINIDYICSVCRRLSTFCLFEEVFTGSEEMIVNLVCV
jgi:hypothetical protein